MLLYDMGDPIRAVEVLGPDIRSVHVKDARRPKAAGQWGQEVPLGEGEVDIKRFVLALKKIGYTGPLIVEREVGDQAGRLRDVARGLDYLRACLSVVGQLSVVSCQLGGTRILRVLHERQRSVVS